MVFLLNVLFAVLGYVLADYVLGRVGVDNPVRVVAAVIVAIVVFLANLAAQVL